MNLADRYGANEMWIANVGDLKPLELPIEFFLAMAWNPADVGKDRIAEWTRDWAARQFGPDHASEIAFLAQRYAKYNGMCKPEQLRPGTYSLDQYREAERMCDAWSDLVRRADAVDAALRPDQRDAFYQLVLHPVRACANLMLMYAAAARNARFAQQARASTKDEAEEVRRRFRYDHTLRDTYNHVLAGGKWNHLMDQTHIGYFDWYPPEVDIMPPVADLDLAGIGGFGVSVDGDHRSWPGFYLPPKLPTLDSITRLPTYLDVYPRGLADAPVTVTADQPWVTIREGKAFSASPRDRRFWVDVDWSKAPSGKASATIAVKGDETIKVRLDAIRATPEQERESRGAFGGLSGPFAIPVTTFDRMVPVGEVRWEAIPDFGRVDAAMSIFPVDAPSFADPTRAPRLEYPIFLPAAGRYHVDLVTSPTLEVIPGRKLSVAVWLNDHRPEIRTVFTPEDGAAEDFLGDRHPINTAHNARTMRFTIDADRPGRHTLTIGMIDPTLVLQTIAVSSQPLKPSYFGPSMIAERPAKPGQPVSPWMILRS